MISTFLFYVSLLFCACSSEEQLSSAKITEDFEVGSKGSYAVAEVTLKSGAWTLDDALLGTSDEDAKRGAKAVRLRNEGKITTNFNAAAKKISISYGLYGSDGNSSWELWTSIDGGKSWKKAGNTVSTTTKALKTATFDVVGTNGIRIEVRKMADSERINIDDIVFDPQGATTAPPDDDNSGTGGAGNSTTTGRDDHLALGNPSNATSNTNNDENYLLSKPQFALSYSKSRGIANWVSWHLNSAWKGSAERQNDFRPDTELPTGWFRASTSDYTNSGFDRGHICPSDDRDGSQTDNSATFLMTNIMPQAPQNNQQTWRFLEEYARKLAEEGNEMYVISGGYGIGGSGKNGGTTRTLANGEITVPARTWKIILLLPNGSNDLSRINNNTRIIAVDMPNTEDVIDKPWGSYRVSVDELERKTGYDFFSRIPKAVQDALEAKTDTGATQ